MPESSTRILAQKNASQKRCRALKRINGICMNCSSPARERRTLCQRCSAYYVEKGRQDIAKRKRDGKCRSCGGEKTDQSMCVDCRIKCMAQRLGGKVKSGLWLILKRKLESQDYRCAYSGELIFPGINASIDHIHPRSKGGTHDEENLHWVSSVVNRMKGSLLQEQFVALCKMIGRPGGKGG